MSQWGITFTFDKNYETGTFANGDYWVIGPVKITAISPAYSGGKNGWEVNPKVSGAQGLDQNTGRAWRICKPKSGRCGLCGFDRKFGYG